MISTPRDANTPGRGEPMNDMKLGITLVAAAVALAGCGEQKPAAKAEAKPAAAAPAALEVKIGHVGPLTGGIAHLGKDNQNGARLAVAQANAARTPLAGQGVN